jgi:hypothetical protein
VSALRRAPRAVPARPPGRLTGLDRQPAQISVANPNIFLKPPRPHANALPPPALAPPRLPVGCGGKPGEPGSGLDALDLKYIEQGSWYCDDPKKLDVKPNVVQPLR